jgi:hypothetical protein
VNIVCRMFKYGVELSNKHYDVEIEARVRQTL